MRRFVLLLIVLFATNALQAQKKLVAVFDSYGSSVSEEVRIAVRDALQEGIVKSRKYEVLEREQIESVQKEYIFQSNASDEELQGWSKLVSADYTCFANVTKIGSNYQVACKLIEASSSYKIVFMDSYRTKGGEEELMTGLEFIANEMFSGRSGKATIPCHNCCGSDECEISLSDEKKETYEVALSICENKGDGWSLPSKEELINIYKNKQNIIDAGGRKFESADYWSSTKRNNYEAFAVSFSSGVEEYYSNLERNHFRCIRKR